VSSSALGLDQAGTQNHSREDSLQKHRRIVIKSDGRFVFLDPEEIDWVEAKGNNVCLHAGADTFVQRQTLTAFEQRLDRNRFLRIHRSAIVNVDKIRELRPWPTGEYVVVLRNGKELTFSRSYRWQLAALLAGLGPQEDLPGCSDTGDPS